MSPHMGVHNLFNFIAFFNVGINLLIATFLVKSVLSVDSRYESCKPRNCGTGPNISYPFYIHDGGADYCGHPGFIIGCEDDRPNYRTSRGRYIIKNISYENQSFRLVNNKLINSTSSYAPLDNFTFDRSNSLEFSPYHADLFFFYNCTDSFSVNYTNSSISCGSNPMKNYSVVLVPGIKDLNTNACESSVAAPVELEEWGFNVTIKDVDYMKLLKDGFTLKWSGFGYNCVKCQNSGGQCGFENGTSVCFCPDGSHLKHCNDAMCSLTGPHNFFNFEVVFHVGINIVIYTSLVQSVLSAHSKYEACKPRNCGSGPNISYPFYIYDAGVDFCGYPGFGIDCIEHEPIYRTSSGHFIIKDISYENKSFHLLSEEVTNSSCFTPLHNYSYDRSSLEFSPYHADLFFFYNCTNSFSVNYTKSRISCASTAMHDSFVALVHRDEPLNWNRSDCESVIAAPVQMEEGEVNQTINDVDIPKLLNDGFTLNWIGFGYNCAECRRSGGQCGFEKGNSVCFCLDGTHLKHCNDNRGKKILKLGLGIGCPAILIIIISSIYIIWHRYKRKYSSPKFLSSNTPSDPSSKSDLEGGSVYFGVPIFSHSELEEATNNFNSEKELGDGGFGIVYHGKLRDGREVAVKRLFEHNYRRVEQFMNEIEILTRLRHKNLVTLYGYTSRRSRDLLLVYEYIPNGTVADHLHGERAKPNSLTWPVRMNIAIETASALAYLHASDTIHRDVKTSNILLDNNFSVKVADFGLSRLFPNDVTHVSTAPQGTPGYVDPEYYQCYQLTDRSDVYSFGVVLIELISSMPAVDITRHRHEINLANLAINKIQKCAFDELIDSCLGYQSNEEIRRMTTSVAELAFRCLQQDKEMRPSMDEVSEELLRIQSGENKLENLEEHENNDVKQREQPPLSPPECDEVSLVKNIRLPPPSPISVTDKWISSDTTPNASG